VTPAGPLAIVADCHGVFSILASPAGPALRPLAAIGDPEGTRTITAIVVFLVALGTALLLLARWVHRTTRPDPELLAPLERMGERAWRRGDPVWQRRSLDEVRPTGAEPLTPSVAPPEFDESFDDGPSAVGFDDLADDPEPRVRFPRLPGEPLALSSTPLGLRRPDRVLFEGDFDADAVAAAGEELDRELSTRRREPGRS
jgi:hypothetical protein